jgi:hypothetical protein
MSVGAQAVLLIFFFAMGMLVVIASLLIKHFDNPLLMLALTTLLMVSTVAQNAWRTQRQVAALVDLVGQGQEKP